MFCNATFSSPTIAGKESFVVSIARSGERATLRCRDGECLAMHVLGAPQGMRDHAGRHGRARQAIHQDEAAQSVAALKAVESDRPRESQVAHANIVQPQRGATAVFARIA